MEREVSEFFIFIYLFKHLIILFAIDERWGERSSEDKWILLFVVPNPVIGRDLVAFGLVF